MSKKLIRKASISIVAVFMAVTLAIPVTAGVMELRNQFDWEVEYNQKVHGHMVNAYYANTPELMKAELVKARAGMVALELTPDLYADMRPWKQVPDNRMEYQYEHLDSIIRRVDAVKEDRDRQKAEGTSDQFGDIYEEKMDNLRAFIKEDGWSDDIARGAFYVQNHPFYAWWWDYAAVNFLVWLGGAVISTGLGVVAWRTMPKKNVGRWGEERRVWTWNG